MQEFPVGRICSFSSAAHTARHADHNSTLTALIITAQYLTKNDIIRVLLDDITIYTAYKII